MASDVGPLYCVRCDHDVDPIRTWRGFRVGWTIWRIGLVGVLALSPLLASDYCVMLPSMMFYLAAGGPLRALARTRPVCPRCSLELEHGAPKRGVGLGPTALNADRISTEGDRRPT